LVLGSWFSVLGSWFLVLQKEQSMSTSLPLAGKTAIVTGAARGIGRAIAVRLAADGANILAFDLAGSALAECVAAVHEHGRQCAIYEGSVAVVADWEQAIAVAQQHFGRIDILVNNAGIAGAITAIGNYSEDTFDQVLAVNVRGVFLGIKYTSKAMAHGGSIINIASISGLSGSRNTMAYTASKHAVVGMTKVAALEFARQGIRVNAVCPAPTATEMVFGLERAVSPDDPKAFRERFENSIPLGRYGEPAEIANVVAFLAGPQASFMTGAAVSVDGGMLAQ
jgi:3alpha(or 20beta)-hydroxysteroid dehydrogenase